MPQQVLRKSFDKGALWRFKGWLKVGRLCARRQETLPRLTRFEGNFQTFGLICKLTVVLASQVLMCDLSLATGGWMQGKEAWDMMMASSICINIYSAHTFPVYYGKDGQVYEDSSEVSQNYSPISATYQASL